MKTGHGLNNEARADSPPTLSKSCSDKLALKQCTSLFSSTVSLVISPKNAYMDTLILPLSQYRAVACERSFGSEGRMRSVARASWSGDYAFRPFNVKTTTVEFPFSRRSTASIRKGSNITAVWTPHAQETLVNGVLQGRKQSDPRGASTISRTKLLSKFLEITSMPSLFERENFLKMCSYKETKNSELLADRREVKNKAKEEALKGWA